MLGQTPDKRRPGHISRQKPPGLLRASLKARLYGLYASVAWRCPVLWAACMKASESSYRLYNCACCEQQVRICRKCDRGNQYCAAQCAAQRRRESVRRAGIRYQGSRRGAHRHAARQRRWRERSTPIVTHQGSLGDTATSTITVIATAGPEPSFRVHPLSEAVPWRVGDVSPCRSRCHFCGSVLPRFARLGRLRGGP